MKVNVGDPLACFETCNFVDTSVINKIILCHAWLALTILTNLDLYLKYKNAVH